MPRGALHQTISTREATTARLLRTVPRDFELSCRYTTTGGSTYKSVTFRFDQSDDEQYANFVYSSAHEPGSKIQIAMTRQGKSSYPAAAARSHKVEVGKSHEIRFAVRDTLVNVWLDDEFMIAYRLPDRRPGFLSLSGFDATVAFDEITIRSLKVDTELTEAGKGATPTVLDPEQAMVAAEARLAAAVAKQRSLEATIAADRATYQTATSAESTSRLAKTAARLQAESQRESARYELLAGGDDKKIKAAKQQIKSAEKRLQEIEKGEFKYAPIRGAKKALESPAHQEADYPTSYSPTSTGRRLALARWIASPQNPLTARVAVNQVWMRHFGTPLVESVFDFGLRAKPPLHADLIDLLASELIDSGWRLKHLHRLIVTSEAYRLSSSSIGGESSSAVDPTNQSYWRMNARRMESQVVRDSLLSFAGKLDTQLGGPSIDPKANTTRRSLYFKHSPDQQNKFLEMFDDADVLQCYRRSESIVPQQALALSNSSLATQMAGYIEARISSSLENSENTVFIKAVFGSLLGREATDAEVRECEKFFADMATLAGESTPNEHQRRSRVQLVQSILNHNDFVTIR